MRDMTKAILIRHRKNWDKIRDQRRIEKYDGKCAACRQDFTLPELQMHHIKPISEWGTNEWVNLQLLCKPCHVIAHVNRGGIATYQMRW